MTNHKPNASKKPVAKKKHAVPDGMKAVLAAIRENVSDEQASLYQGAQQYLGALESESVRGDKAATIDSLRDDDVSVVIATVRAEGVEAYVAKLRAIAPQVKTRVLESGDSEQDAIADLIDEASI